MMISKEYALRLVRLKKAKITSTSKDDRGLKIKAIERYDVNRTDYFDDTEPQITIVWPEMIYISPNSEFVAAKTKMLKFISRINKTPGNRFTLDDCTRLSRVSRSGTWAYYHPPMKPDKQTKIIKIDGEYKILN